MGVGAASTCTMSGKKVHVRYFISWWVLMSWSVWHYIDRETRRTRTLRWRWRHGCCCCVWSAT